MLFIIKLIDGFSELFWLETRKGRMNANICEFSSSTAYDSIPSTLFIFSSLLSSLKYRDCIYKFWPRYIFLFDFLMIFSIYVFFQVLFT